MKKYWNPSKPLKLREKLIFLVELREKSTCLVLACFRPEILIFDGRHIDKILNIYNKEFSIESFRSISRLVKEIEHFEVYHQLRENYKSREKMWNSVENSWDSVKNRFVLGNYVENRHPGFRGVFDQNHSIPMETYRQDIKDIQEGSDYRKFQVAISSRKRNRALWSLS